MAQPLHVYICSDPADENLVTDLRKHLASLERNGLVQLWSESQIAAGTLKQAEIDRHLDRADLVLLIVSASFLASSSCTEITSRALARYSAARTVVIPVVVRPCMLDASPFSHLKPLPDGARPVTSWSDRDEAWLNVVRGIRLVIERLRQA